jgi:diaminopimelate decarboxylase
VYEAAIREVLDGGAVWIPGQDLEVEWLSESLGPGAGALVPPADALGRVSKPRITAAAALPFQIPPFISAGRADWELHGFLREHGWRVWVKGPNYEAMRARDWPSFRYAREVLSNTWGTESLFLQRHVAGAEESVAFCAFGGELLDCVHMSKHTQTHEGKTWAGALAQVSPAIAEPLRAVLAELEWTGGGELEYVRAPDGTLHLIDWNPRFPAWIHAAAFAGHNLPARLVEAAGFGTPAAAPYRGRQFTRVVMEIPVLAEYPLPPVRDPLDDAPAGSKHPSGMPDLARRLAEGRGGAVPEPRADGKKQPRRPARRPPPPVPAAMQWDLDEALVGELPTPRRILLPRMAQERFAQVERAISAGSGCGVELGFGYSVKTNPHPSLLALADASGMYAEVISAAELRQALAAGFPVERVVVNGPASQWPAGPQPEGEMVAAFADSPQSFARWLEGGPPRARYLGMRLRPAALESRFGASLGAPKRFRETVALLRSMPAGQALGLHFHFASDVLGPARWFEVFESVLHWAAAIQEGAGRAVRCLDVGGGWFPDDFDRELLPALPDRVAAAAAALPGLERFVVEPGKAMAQPAMALAATVLEVRRGRDGAVEAVVDAAISDLPMAPFYPHRVYARPGPGGWEPLGGGGDRLLGRICMETDILASDLALPDAIAVGDRLVIGDAGAYDASMAYNFGRGVLDDACC